MQELLKEYLKEVQQKYETEKAREHAYRGAFETFLRKAGAELDFGKLTVINEPAHVECNAPDYVVQYSNLPVGYIEAKDLNVNLSDIEDTDQFRRYSDAFPNLVTTNYLELRHYFNGEHRRTAKLADIVKGKVQQADSAEKDAKSLLLGFLSQKPQQIVKASVLVKRMSHLAHILREVIEKALDHDMQKKKESHITDQFHGVRQLLIAELEPEEFADMYAQTLVYGTFAARLEFQSHEHDEGQTFDLQKALSEIPDTNPLLKEVFGRFGGANADKRIKWLLDDLALLLKNTNLKLILDEWDEYRKGEDWVVHFYENFLQEYDPVQRERRGVYYTPQPVIRYIVRAVDEVLKRDFGLKDGLADAGKTTQSYPVPGGGETTKEFHKVQILDPAVGTGSFLFGVVNFIYNQFVMDDRQGEWPGYVRDHLLPRLNGFELQMAPYTIAHIKLGRQLAERGYEFEDDNRFNIFLTNTLENPNQHSDGLFGVRNELVREAESARKVKRETPILVVLGNPPYSGHSANSSYEMKEVKGKQKRVLNFIGELVKDYSKGFPELNRPAQAKWLQNDYVKFIRWSQWRIDRSGSGILAFITDHSFLDSTTFRGMRRSLLSSFDQIYLYNLHGNSKKKEVVPGIVQQLLSIGPKDENVFDIQQGDVISIFVKLPSDSIEPEVVNDSGDKDSVVYYADLWGQRARKYNVLSNDDFYGTKWSKVACKHPSWMFVPQNEELIDEYEGGWSIKDAMNRNGNPAPGIVTTQDQFAISFTRESALYKVTRFLETTTESEARQLFSLCKQDQWNYRVARDELKKINVSEKVDSILHRPFDIRWTVYDKNVSVHLRMRVMKHFLEEQNLGLITSRQTKDYWSSLATEKCVTHKSLAAYDINYLFPLYLYPDSLNESEASTPGGRRPNLSKEFTNDCEKNWKMEFVINGTGDLKDTFGPEDVFNYMYAVFHSPEYRRRYSDFLKRDFPRLPLTKKKKLLRLLCERGAKLVQLHLMNPSAVDTKKYKLPGYPIPPTSKTAKDKSLTIVGGQVDMNLHAGGGGDIVDKLKYVEDDHQVWINKFQYFSGVSPDVWNFHVGGYQPCQKWLKDRKGRELSYDDIQHYKLICAILAQTADLMEDIDVQIDNNGGWPLA